MSANLLSYAGWTFLPNLVTGWLQTLYYGLTVRVGDPKPLPGTPRYNKHRRRIHILVVTAYLLYTIYEADWQIRREGDFYQDLGVSQDIDERGIKSKFRRLAAQFHPDKVTNSEARESESYFVHLRLAQDTLLDPTRRFAYDRFGPDVVNWRHCASVRDYVLAGMQVIAPYYVASGLVMVILGVSGYLDWGKYWRYASFASLLVFEMHTVTRPYYPPITTKIFKAILTTVTNHSPYLPFQQLILARKIMLTVFIALSQLGPLLQPPQAQQQNPEQSQRQSIDRLEQLTKSTEMETTRLLALDLAPVAGDEKAMKGVRTKMKDWLIDNTVRADPEVRDAVGRVMQKRRVGAPTGARGTR
ncbi:MAG: hypothetical protein M1836_005456 [Candelina mexicana]|nr:MAG: hypothetical protein M1836_005456 [Candelina mexicana]